MQQLSQHSDPRELRLRIFESNYGREGGWFVEREGQRIARLSQPKFEDMFWESYLLEPLSPNPEECDCMLHSPDFWLSEFTYRSIAFGIVAEYALPALNPVRVPGRILMRGLYLLLEEPSAWERMLLWWRKRKQPAATLNT